MEATPETEPERNARTSDLGAEETKWRIRSSQVATFVTLVGLIAGGFKFLDQRDKSLKAQARTDQIRAETAKRESQKPFLERQLNTCFETVKAVGQLAAENEPGTAVTPEEHAKTATQFWMQYHGVLSVVENKDVEAAMVQLGNAIRECEKKHQKCDLQSPANQLAHACRELVLTGWDIDKVQYNR